MKNLFVYGTLMKPSVMLSVSGVLPESVEAELKGYKAGMVKGAYFPGLVANEEGEQWGMLYLGLPEEAFVGLDRYEGTPDLYKRETVTVTTEEGEEEVAEVYVFQDGSRVTDEPFVLI